MFKEILSKISRRILYILFAVIVSITLWMYVEITENEIQINTLSNIEIIFKNEDVLRDRNLLVTSFSPSQLAITFEAPRAEMTRLAARGNLMVEVDLANISASGPTELIYDIIYPSGVNVNAVDVLGSSVERITLMVDRVLERQLQVIVNYTGGVASDNLIPESAEFDPQVITVWGPERVVSRIMNVRVPIIRENLATTYREELEFVLIDENNEVLELEEHLLEMLEFSQETIHVTIPIMEIKDVPLTVILAHGVSTSEANTNWNCEPLSIKVKGDPVAIRELNHILLGTVNMMRVFLSDTEAFPIILPNNIMNVSGETEATVYVEVIGLDIAFRSTSNLMVVNTPPGHRAEILTQNLVVRLRGLTEDLAMITPLNLRAVADLNDMGAGTATVNAKIYIDGIDAPIDPVGEYEIAVAIIAE